MIFCNVVLVLTTLLAYLLPFMAPKWFPFLSVLTLILPLFLILNLLFFVFWLIQFKKYIFISGIALLLGITFINKFYNLKATILPQNKSDFQIMSYNVRLFNKFKWVAKANIPKEIVRFVEEKDPDIVCIQEYSDLKEGSLQAYPNRYIFKEGKNIIVGNAIFSKYKIINKGNIKFPESNNNAVFADVVKDNDTMRIYSIHLESIKISTDIEDEDIEQMNESKSKKIYRRISKAFKKQQEQAELIKLHYKDCPYKKIICGDLNNSAFSYVYRTVKGNMQDCFETNGTGFGKSYSFKYYPARIDYILVDKHLKVKQFDTYNEFVNSDHYPLVARIGSKEE